MQCKLCAEMGEVACNSCNQSMPAGLGSECLACYWKKAAHNRLSIEIKERLSSLLYQEEFYAYGVWLIGQVGDKEAALLVHKHMAFFVQMEERWDFLPGYEQMLSTFGADWLRRAKYPVRWLIASHGLVIDETLKQRATEQRRINEILTSVGPGLPLQMLAGYRDVLLTRAAAQTTTLRSSRIALRSAANLLIHSTAHGSKPSSKRLRELLVRTPGLAASLKGFVTFLNESYNLSIQLPNYSETQKLKRKKQEQMIITLASQAREGEDVSKQWVPAALRYFHGVSRARQSDLSVRDDVEGLLVTADGTEYWIPSPTMGLTHR